MKSLFTVLAMFLLYSSCFTQQLHLNTNGSWLNLGDLDVSGDQITLEAWIYMERKPLVKNKFNILSKHLNDGDVNYFFRHSNFGITTHNSGTSGPTSFYNLFSNYTFQLRQWYHVAATYDGKKMAYYVNGCLTNSQAASGQLVQNDLATALGQRSNIRDEQFYGFLEEVKIWKTALSQKEIIEGIKPKQGNARQAALVAHYSFDKDFNNPHSGNAFAGSAVGTPRIAQCKQALPFLTTFPFKVTTGPGSTIQVETPAPFEFSIDGGPYSYLKYWTGLAAGAHTISTKFAQSCIPISDTIVEVSPERPANAALHYTQQPAPIYWQNPSFEGEPQDATVPIGWLGCEAMTTPDILPGVWGIYQEASDGDTYVGLITRANGTWESITQRLPRTIEKTECYVFGLDLARGATYSGYSNPLKIRIWGSTDRCSKDQLLYESPLIEHTYWKQHRVEFTAEQPIRYIIFEAFHKEGPFRYPGNILLDNLTPIQVCPRA